MRNLKKFLALVLALMMVVSVMVTVSAKDYTDQADINYDEAVAVMSAVGVIEGDEKGAFNPAGTLTREQAAKLVTYMILGKDAANKLGTPTDPFDDVKADSWAAGSIAYCANAGLIDGDGQGHFYPTLNVNGYQFAKLMLGVLGYKSDIEQFTKTGWEINVAAIALKEADLTADSTIDLSKELTREEAAQMAFNTIKANTVTYQGGTNVTLSDGTSIVVNAVRNEGDIFRTINYKGLAYYATDDPRTGNQDGVDGKITAADATDVYGRANAGVWKNGTTTVYADAPAETVTLTGPMADADKAVENYEIDTDGGYGAAPNYDYTGGTEVYVNGKLNQELTKNIQTTNKVGDKTVIAYLTSVNNNKVEIYTGADGKTITSVVVITTYAYKLTGDDIDADKGTITIPGPGKATIDVETTAYAKDDVITYTCGVANGKTVALDIAKAEAVTGTMEKFSSAAATGDDTAAKKADAQDDVKALLDGKEHTFYVIGNTIVAYEGEKTAAASTDYAIVLDANVTKATWPATGFTAQVKVLTSAGDVAIYNLPIAKATAEKVGEVQIGVGSYYVMIGGVATKLDGVTDEESNTDTVKGAITKVLTGVYPYTTKDGAITLETALKDAKDKSTDKAGTYANKLDTGKPSTAIKNGDTSVAVVEDSSKVTAVINGNTKFILSDGKDGYVVKTRTELGATTIQAASKQDVYIITTATKAGEDKDAVYVAAYVIANIAFKTSAPTATEDLAFVPGTYSQSIVDGEPVYTYDVYLMDGTKTTMNGGKDVKAGIYKTNPDNTLSGTQPDTTLMVSGKKVTAVVGTDTITVDTDGTFNIGGATVVYVGGVTKLEADKCDIYGVRTAANSLDLKVVFVVAHTEAE